MPPKGTHKKRCPCCGRFRFVFSWEEHCCCAGCERIRLGGGLVSFKEAPSVYCLLAEAEETRKTASELQEQVDRQYHGVQADDL